MEVDRTQLKKSCAEFCTISCLLFESEREYTLFNGGTRSGLEKLGGYGMSTGVAIALGVFGSMVVITLLIIFAVVAGVSAAVAADDKRDEN